MLDSKYLFMFILDCKDGRLWRWGRSVIVEDGAFVRPVPGALHRKSRPGNPGILTLTIAPRLRVVDQKAFDIRQEFARKLPISLKVQFSTQYLMSEDAAFGF